MATESNATQDRSQGRDQSSDTVIVSCKLPHGLVLHLDVMEEKEEVTQGGTKKVMMARRLPDTFTVNGNSVPEGAAHAKRIEAGYALTYGVPKALWEQWAKNNKDLPAVRNGLIFAHSSERSATAEAREKEGVRSGFERLNPNALPKGMERAAVTA